MPRNYWMVVLTPENYLVTREQEFKVQGLKRSQRKKAQRIEVGDRMLFYISRMQVFAAAATVTSTFFEDHSKLWKDYHPEEDFPYRVNIESNAVLEEEQFIDAHQVAPRMDFVKKWIPEWWPLAFIGDLHIIPKKDLTMIEDEMKKMTSRSGRRRGRSRRRMGARV